MMEARIKQLQTQKRLNTIMIAVGVIALSIWSAYGTEFSLSYLISGSGEIFKFIVFDFLPPDWSALESLWRPAMETLYMSFFAMVVGAVMSGVLAFFAAATTAPNRFIQTIVRAFCSILRNIPTLIWALLLVFAYGLGTTVGCIALIFTSIGTLTRAYAEVLEEIDLGQVEAVRATGATYFQVLGQAVVPQFMPGFIGWSLYKLELNVRASTIVGMVGGGGLGYVIQRDIKLFQYAEVSMAIILVIVLVFATEWITSKIRERII
jgi:phosphonate transport system permease protein